MTSWLDFRPSIECDNEASLFYAASLWVRHAIFLPDGKNIAWRSQRASAWEAIVKPMPWNICAIAFLADTTEITSWFLVAISDSFQRPKRYETLFSIGYIYSY